MLMLYGKKPRTGDVARNTDGVVSGRRSALQTGLTCASCLTPKLDPSVMFFMSAMVRCEHRRRRADGCGAVPQ